jgi:hypothetical protein
VALALDRWIGYYSTSLSGSDGLANGSDQIAYYGQILQTEEALTTTDMGTGEFASAGQGNAAYIHNMSVTGVKLKKAAIDFFVL